MKLMSNIWIMSGAMLVDSKLDFDRASGAYKKVRMIHMSQALSYADFFMRKSMEHPGPPHKVVAWLVDRDRQTRSKARQLFQQGWPWREALLHSRDVLCQVLWTCGEKGITARQIPVIGEPNEDFERDDNHQQGALTNSERQRLRQLEQAEQQRQRSRRQSAAQKGGGKPSGQGFGRGGRRRGAKGGRGGNSSGGGKGGKGIK